MQGKSSIVEMKQYPRTILPSTQGLNVAEIVTQILLNQISVVSTANTKIKAVLQETDELQQKSCSNI